jgi:cobalt-precorrin 5A hydrolase
MDMGEAVMVAGIGCRGGVSGEQVEAAIAAAVAALCAARTDRESAASSAAMLTAIATPAVKADEPGIQQAAAARGVPLLAISQVLLEAANPATVTRSAHSMAAMNVHSVAEAAALAGAVAIAEAAAASPGAVAPTEAVAASPRAVAIAEAAAASAGAVAPTEAVAASPRAVALTEAAAASPDAVAPTEAARATATARAPTPTPRLLQPRVVVGPVTCALADITRP